PTSLDVIGMAQRTGIGTGGDRSTTTATHPGDAGDSHQPLDLVTADLQAPAQGGLPQLAPPIQAPIRSPQVEELVRRIRLGQVSAGRPEAASSVGVVGARGDLDTVLGQHGTDRLDPEPVTVPVNVVHYRPSLRSSSADATKADAVRSISFARRS